MTAALEKQRNAFEKRMKEEAAARESARLAREAEEARKLEAKLAAERAAEEAKAKAEAEEA